MAIRKKAVSKEAPAVKEAPVVKKAVKGAALSPAELKAFQQKGFTKPKGFKPGR